MEELDQESAQIKEVYARYGLAMYQAQCVEREIAILLATVHGPGANRMTRAEYDELLDSLFRRVLGNLIRRLRDATSLREDFDTFLQETLEKRNWLAHNYFWERAGHFVTEEGRTMMLDELTSIIAEFEEMDHSLHLINREWAREHGVTEEIEQEALERIIQQARGGV